MTKQKEREMDAYLAAMIADGVQEPADEDEHHAAWQYLINTGMAWRLQGRIGRTARNFIDAGYCKVSPQA